MQCKRCGNEMRGIEDIATGETIYHCDQCCDRRIPDHYCAYFNADGSVRDGHIGKVKMPFTEKNTIWMYEVATIKGGDGKPLGLFQCAHCGTIKTVPPFRVRRIYGAPWRKMIEFGMQTCPKCLRAFEEAQGIHKSV